MVSGAGYHSAPTGEGGGSPSVRAGAELSSSVSLSAPPSESTVARRINGLHMQGDDMPSSQPAASKKKKRGARAGGPDKNGRGLRQFSVRVCEKVESKGRTTYNEVADELVAEFSDPNNNIDSPDLDNPSAQQYDEKNIRRRVYDALNVLMAMKIISKDNKKEIQWRGLPKTSTNDIEELKDEVTGLKSRIEKKNAYLQDLEEQYACIQNLVRRNKQLYGSGDAPSKRLDLPFIILQTRRHANIQMEVSEDDWRIDYCSTTPYELWDESFVMKAMGLCGKEETDYTQARVGNGGESSSTPNNHLHQSPLPPEPRANRVPNSPPIPGILKGHAKHI